MEHRPQTDKGRDVGIAKNRLPVSVTQPPGVSRGQWNTPHKGRTTQHHIRNPKLRQYYLKEAAFPSDFPARESRNGNEQVLHHEDTVFSVASQFSRRPVDASLETLSTCPTLLHTQLRRVPQCKTSTYGSVTMAMSSDLRPASEPTLEAMTPTTPVSPATDAEYDKLLDVEAVPMPDGQLCLLALPPECTQGAGPADTPYLKLFSRFITDRKGVVSGVLLVTANKIFFDPHKSLPLVQENGCEDYLFSCLVDNLSSITFFSDISHVHFSQSTQRWKGHKKAWKFGASKQLVKETQRKSLESTPQPQMEATPTAMPAGMSRLGAGLGAEPEAVQLKTRAGRAETWPRWSASWSTWLWSPAGRWGGVMLGGVVLNSAATFCCGGVNTGGGARAEPVQVQKTARPPCSETQLLGPGGWHQPPTSSLMFVRLRQKQLTTKRRGFVALELSKLKTTPPGDAWFALQQEKSDELYAYLSQHRPDLCILEGAEEEEVERDEDDFVLLDNREDGEQEVVGSQRDGHAGEEWEMVCVEDSRARTSVCIDREPEGLHDILKQSLILDTRHVRELTVEMPARTVGQTWRLTYSTTQHGSSLKTLYRRLGSSDSPVLLLIRDDNQQVFGAFLSHPLHMSEKFYGTGETFLFLLHPRFKSFRWTGENSFFIKGDIDSFAIGGGSGHFGLWLDETLYLGRSSPCSTFNNCSLSESSDFRVLELEAWTFW
ncbi:LOW QUALITY PROTEIN: nuclear receptor coactivator 7 [Brachyhypopomus gauderio]|uniref:LOW QUALITY PROTEIN: nuclear receptor coactivator 7 n=1 Tax=Brachyhypopomus gauderio TaxID=698409 RepID=UPI00404304E2